MTKEIIKLFDKLPFIENGYIIDLNDEPLEVHPVLGQRRHWNIYCIENYEAVQLVGLSSKNLNELKGFIERIKKPND